MKLVDRAVRFAPAIGALVLFSASGAYAQTGAGAAPAAAAPAQAPAQAAAKTKIAEGTEFQIRLDDKLSSRTNKTGDRFGFSLASDVRLPDGTVIPAGSKGVGEVTDANKSGMFGKPGALNVKFNYLKVGDTRVPLRGTKGNEGKGSVASVVALTALFGIAGFLVHGHNVDVAEGQAMTAFADQDTFVALPLSGATST